MRTVKVIVKVVVDDDELADPLNDDAVQASVEEAIEKSLAMCEGAGFEHMFENLFSMHIESVRAEEPV